MPSVYKASASTTTDVQVHTVSVGFAELAGITYSSAGTTTVSLHDGTNSSAPVLFSENITAAGARTHVLPNVRFYTGLFLDRTGNASAVTVFLAV